MDGQHSLGSVPELAPYADKLSSLGYSTYEEFFYVAEVASLELAAYLGITSTDHLIATITSVQATQIISADLETIRNANYSLGVDVDGISRPTIAPPISSVASLPPTVDLRSQLPEVRDQGKRGTCVAHATLAAYEQFLMTQGSPVDLSEQFLYWNCKLNDGSPMIEGTSLQHAFPLLKRDGCCLETTWPYVPHPAGTVGQGPASTEALREALIYKPLDIKTIAPTSVEDLKSELARERCVAVSVPIYNSWLLNLGVAETGIIGNPLPTEPRRGGHAVCLVGYVDEPGNRGIGHGRFLVRNSWGKSWGLRSPYGVGYGTIPYSYISRLCLEACSII